MTRIIIILSIIFGSMYLFNQNSNDNLEAAKARQIKAAATVEKAKAAQPASRVAYFKANKNRIMLYRLKKRPSSEQEMHDIIQEIAPISTPGRMTAVYFFEPGTTMPGPGFSSMATIFKANETLYDSPRVAPWTFAYKININGSTEFANCLKRQGDNMCRN